MSKLPFERRIFWTVFLVVQALVLLTFYLFFKYTPYQLTNADRYGALISATILSYLVHLWLLPPEYDDEEYDHEPYEADDDGERSDQPEAADSGNAAGTETAPDAAKG